MFFFFSTLQGRYLFRRSRGGVVFDAMFFLRSRGRVLFDSRFFFRRARGGMFYDALGEGCFFKNAREDVFKLVSSL